MQLMVGDDPLLISEDLCPDSTNGGGSSTALPITGPVMAALLTINRTFARSKSIHDMHLTRLPSIVGEARPVSDDSDAEEGGRGGRRCAAKDYGGDGQGWVVPPMHEEQASNKLQQAGESGLTFAIGHSAEESMAPRDLPTAPATCPQPLRKASFASSALRAMRRSFSGSRGGGGGVRPMSDHCEAVVSSDNCAVPTEGGVTLYDEYGIPRVASPSRDGGQDDTSSSDEGARQAAIHKKRTHSHLCGRLMREMEANATSVTAVHSRSSCHLRRSKSCGSEEVRNASSLHHQLVLSAALDSNEVLLADVDKIATDNGPSPHTSQSDARHRSASHCRQKERTAHRTHSMVMHANPPVRVVPVDQLPHRGSGHQQQSRALHRVNSFYRITVDHCISDAASCSSFSDNQSCNTKQRHTQPPMPCDRINDDITSLASGSSSNGDRDTVCTITRPRHKVTPSTAALLQLDQTASQLVLTLQQQQCLEPSIPEESNSSPSETTTDQPQLFAVIQSRSSLGSNSSHSSVGGSAHGSRDSQRSKGVVRFEESQKCSPVSAKVRGCNDGDHGGGGGVGYYRDMFPQQPRQAHAERRRLRDRAYSYPQPTLCTSVNSPGRAGSPPSRRSSGDWSSAIFI